MERINGLRSGLLVPLFAEKVILAAVVPLCVLLVVNPMQFDRHQQISAIIALLAGGYFVAHTLEKQARARPAPAPTVMNRPAQSTATPSAPGSASTMGACSPVVTGDGNTTTTNCGDSLKVPASKPEK